MIANVVFDIGNVLLNFKPLEYLSQHFNDPVLAGNLHRQIFRSSEWPSLDEGTITVDDAVKVFCERNPENEDAIKYVMSDWYNLLTPIEGTVNIMKELKKKGYKTYALSNFHLKAFDKCLKQHEFFKLFDGMVISSKVKCLKPGEQIYNILVREYGITPEETIFIDDSPENIYTAKRLGFKAIHFTSPDELYKELKNYLTL